MVRFCLNCHLIKIDSCFDFVCLNLIYWQSDKISGDEGDTTEDVQMRKVVFEEELIDEDMAELDPDAIGKSIILILDSESSEVL